MADRTVFLSTFCFSRLIFYLITKVYVVGLVLNTVVYFYPLWFNVPAISFGFQIIQCLLFRGRLAFMEWFGSCRTAEVEMCVCKRWHIVGI